MTDLVLAVLIVGVALGIIVALICAVVWLMHVIDRDNGGGWRARRRQRRTWSP